jgi:hypothetical protein
VDDAECCDVMPGALNRTEGTVGEQWTHGNRRAYRRRTHNVNRCRRRFAEREGSFAELPVKVKSSTTDVKHSRRTVTAS